VDGDALHEVEPEPNHLEWLIRKDGCMHCDDPGCLKACPSPGAIVKYANGIVDFISEHCIGCGYCVTGCPFNVPRISRRTTRPTSARCAPTAWGGPGAGLRQDLPDRRHHVRHQGGHGTRRGAHRRPEGARLREAGLYDPAGVGGTHVMYVLHHADKPSLTRPARQPQISPWCRLEGHAKPRRWP
jgi:formate dehydrogenase iron-sulfur subunit